MSILKRIASLTKGAANEVLDKLENPVVMMGQYLRDMEADIDTAERMLVEQQTVAKVLKRRHEEAVRLADQSEQQALAALADGNEEAARLALAAKMQYTQQSEEHAAGHEAAEQRIQELDLHIVNAKEEFVRLKEKRSELTARAQKATERAQSVRPSFSYGLHTGTAARGFERMEEKILQQEARLDAAGYPHGTSLSSADTGMNAARNLAIDEELKRLQSKLTTA